MKPEEIIQKINNVEWDSNGNPLYSYDQMLNAVKQSEVFSFAEFCGEHFVKMKGGWMPRYADQRNIENLITTEQVYLRWKNNQANKISNINTQQ